MEEVRNEVLTSVAKRAAPVFEREGWEWGHCGVPDALDIYHTLTDLCLSFTDLDVKQVRSGRFLARRIEDEYGNTEEIVIALELGHIDTNPYYINP